MTDEAQQNSDSNPVSIPASDRRAHPRQRIRSLAYVHLGESNGGIVLNISEGGIAVQAAEALDAGEGPLAMRIEIPRSRKRLEISGEIMWVGDSRKEAGLRFVDLSEDALKRIRSWMAREDSPGTAVEESEEEVEAPVARAAQARTETVVTAQDFSDRGERVAEAEEFASEDAEGFRETGEPVEGDDEAVEFAEASADESASEAAVEPMAAAEKSGEDAAVAMEASSRATNAPVVPAAATGREEDRARTIAPPVLTFEKKPQIPNSPYTPISGGHGAPAFAVAVAPPAPARYSTSDAASSLFPQPRVSAEPVAAGDGWKSFRVQLQSGWFLAVLVLLLATISFIAGMAVRRGALNGVMGDVDDLVQPKSAPAPSSGNLTGNPAANASGNGSGTAASNAPPKPLQIEIVDLENHHWTIPAALGANHGDASAAQQTQVNAAVARNDAAATAPTATNLPNQKPPQGAPSNDAAAAAKPGAPLMLSLPETPISASGSVAIRATSMVPVPTGDAQSPQRARNLQIGELTNLVEPVYPPDARQARLEGTVKLHVVVAANGEVQSFRTVSGPESLAQAAMIAVREWRYRPTLLNGKAVEMQEDVSFVFRLPN
jgi:TonB family protein